MEQGLILTLQFTAFDIESHFTCAYDHLTITDGDGTTLMEKSCGSSSNGLIVGAQSIGSSLPANITSLSNVIKLRFITDTIDARPGWSVSWTVTPGECQTSPQAKRHLITFFKPFFKPVSSHEKLNVKQLIL